MTLKIIGDSPANLFEMAVFRECTKMDLEGILSANMFLPSKENGLDEQDLIIVTQGTIFTLDAKAYEPGHYRGGLNQPLQQKKQNNEKYVEVPARLAKPLAKATYKAKQMISLLHSVMQKMKINNVKNINQLGVKVMSLIVVPDHALFDENSRQKTEEIMKTKAMCKVVRLSELAGCIKAEVTSCISSSTMKEERQRLVDGFIDILKDGISSEQRIINDTQLSEKLVEYDDIVPTQVWKGIKDGEFVLVKIFYKYPWREESSLFYRQLDYQVRAFKKARIPRVLALDDYNDYPEYIVMTFEWFENEGTLEEAVSTLHGLRIQDAIIIIKRIAQIVGDLHDNAIRAPIILRSLHPKDILIDKWHGAVDWREVGFIITGFEKAVIQGRSSAGSEGRSVYEAPELYVLKDKEARQSRTLDVYSIGMLFLFLLTGNQPSHDRKLQDIQITDETRKVISRAIASNPAKRHQTVQEFIGELSNITISNLSVEQ